MTMRFPYQLGRRQTASISLNGRWVQPRPIITVTLVGPNRSWAGVARVDTAADETVFSDSVATTIGIDLTTAPAGRCEAFGGVSYPVRFAIVTLRLADGVERHEWQGWVGFTPAPMRIPLLGFGGCLQYFVATCHGDREIVELTVNSLYPGT